MANARPPCRASSAVHSLRELGASSLVARKHSSLWASVLLAVLILFLGEDPSVQAQVSSRYGNITVTQMPTPKGGLDHGYFEHRFRIVNSSRDQPHTVTLTLPARGESYPGSQIRSISKTIEVDKGGDVSVSLFQPSTPAILGTDVGVRIDGESREPHLPIRIDSAFDPRRRSSRSMARSMGSSGQSVLILVSPDVDRGLLQEASRLRRWERGGFVEDGGMMEGPPGIGAPPPGRGRKMPEEPMPFGRLMRPPARQKPKLLGPVGPGAEIEGPVEFSGIAQTFVSPLSGPDAWTTSWLGYSRFDGVILTPRALAGMNEGARVALWQYVEAGGSLLVLRRARLPESWRSQHNDRDKYTLYQAGFGQCLIPEQDFREWSDDLWLKITDSWQETATPWRSQVSALTANQRLPIVDNIGIPVRGLFVLMLLFGAVIGPVNLALLSRWKKRIWMIWTVPVISAVTCATVFGYAVLAEGWSGRSRTEAITILDETGRRATTVGWTAFYAPLAPRDGLHFGYETELALQDGDENDGYGYHGYRGYREGTGKSCEIDWTDEQHLHKGWVTARIPTHFKLRKSERRLERVEIAPGKDGPILTNGLGSTMEKVWYADESGRLFSAGPVSPGASVPLETTGRSLVADRERKKLRDLYKSDWLSLGKELLARPENCLGPNTYLAELSDAPFVEVGLTGGSQQSHSLVIGIRKHQKGTADAGR
jgi:hypothetical protein